MFKIPKFSQPTFLQNWGKREGLIYLVVISLEKWRNLKN